MCRALGGLPIQLDHQRETHSSNFDSLVTAEQAFAPREAKNEKEYWEIKRHCSEDAGTVVLRDERPACVKERVKQ